MKKPAIYIWLTVAFLLLGKHNLIGQEITVHNLPTDTDFSSLEPHLFEQDGDEKLYILVVFALSENDYIFLNDDQILNFNHELRNQLTLVKDAALFRAMNYHGSHSVVVYNIKNSKREELFKAYLED